MIDFDAIWRKIQEVQRRARAVSALEDRATDISVKYSDMPRGGGGNTQEDIRITLADTREEYLTAKAELESMRRELTESLACLSKWQHKDVIKKRYLEGKTIDQVGLEMGYERAQINRHLSEARRIINAAERAET